MKSLEVIKVPELQAIEKSKAEKIRETFLPMSEMLNSFDDRYNELMSEKESGVTEELTKKAKRLRLDIGKVRIETGKLKDKQKEYIKLEDKAIMGVHNILVWAVKEKEDELKSIELHFENLEKERIAKLQSEREGLILKYVDDIEGLDLGTMNQDVWEAYFDRKKSQYEERLAAEKKAEEERVARLKAEEEERKRIKAENERLRKEAEERQRQEAERIKKEVEERRLREEKERKEREAYEAKLKAEREERERLEREERKKREKLEAELLSKKKAEEAAAKKAEEERQVELRKGDSEHLNDLLSDLEKIKSKYQFKSARYKKIFENVCALVDKVINYVNDKK